jgi:hypothetical protein
MEARVVVPEDKSAIAAEEKVPDTFLCSFDLEIMDDPVTVVSECGHTFNRKNIANWLTSHSTCGHCQAELPSKMLIPNRHLKEAIDIWKSQNKEIVALHAKHRDELLRAREALQKQQSESAAQQQEIRFLKTLVTAPAPPGEFKEVSASAGKATHAPQIDKAVEQQMALIRAIEVAISKKEQEVSAALFLRRRLRNRAIKAIGCSDSKELQEEVKLSALDTATPGIAKQTVSLREHFKLLKKTHMNAKTALTEQIHAQSQKILLSRSGSALPDIAALQNQTKALLNLEEQYIHDRQVLGQHADHFLKTAIKPLLANTLPRLLRIDKIITQKTTELRELRTRETAELEKMAAYTKSRSLKAPDAFGKSRPAFRGRLFGLPYFDGPLWRAQPVQAQPSVAVVAAKPPLSPHR